MARGYGLKIERWLIGDEFDATLLTTLAQTLSELGYDVADPSWAVAGSQALTTWRVAGPRGELSVEAETYVGLSVSGSVELVDEVRNRFAASHLSSRGLA